MTDHMPEPWEVGFGKPNRPYVVAITAEPKLHLEKDTTIVAGTPTGGGPFFGATTGPANARRIVACINACKGIPDHVLQAVIDGKAYITIFPKGALPLECPDCGRGMGDGPETCSCDDGEH